MSIILLFFFLLSLSMHACNARHLGVIDKESGRQLDLSGKDVEKARLDNTSVPSKMKPSSLFEELGMQPEGAANGESMIDESWGGASTQKSKRSEGLLKEVDNKEGTISGVVQMESLVSVSWPVPHDKGRDHDPGFNLDYAPPKTHPPSHN
ncbi:hypothetical protein HHK36_028680 [Tetracentron sinense]|uniref:Uncharacterized protein n=1 Tax=Tetracentron sinense TaxID=13715 RepID=A0A834YCW3_TETSI|nr:hypothetical protein HHK36_028680 [Tetracentron sinense]